MSLYAARVKFEVTDDKGSIKHQMRSYIVNAVSITDADEKVNRYLKDSTEAFEVKIIGDTKYLDYIDA